MNNKVESNNSQPWDDNVMIRAADLEQGTDYSYTHVIKPWVLDRVLKYTNEKSRILDIGCGCGYLTNCVYMLDRHNIKGVDISNVAVQYADEKYPHIKFECQDICALDPSEKFDLCIAVMVLNNMSDMNGFFTAVYDALNVGGHLIIVLPHPFYWPVKHVKNQAFVYRENRNYPVPFATKGRSDYSADIIYYHRPLANYIAAILGVGFKIVDLCELYEAPNDSSPDIICIEVIKSLDNDIISISK